MKRVLRFLIRLYPAWWRRRYGHELEALLGDSGSHDVWDVFRGAMEMQMKTWSFGRIVTVCGIVGLVLAGAVAFSAPYKYRSTTIVPLTVLFQDGSGKRAATQFLLSTIFQERNLDLREQGALPYQAGLLVLRNSPERIIERRRYVLAGLGLPVGLLFGVVLALILRRRRAPAAS
jgi:hypothetical protein